MTRNALARHERVQTFGVDPIVIRDLQLARPPGLCVLAARLGAFGEPPEVVVSGINAKFCAVSAAPTVPECRMARPVFSPVDAEMPWRFDTAAKVALEVLDHLIDAPARSVLNLNVPARSLAELKGCTSSRTRPTAARSGAASEPDARVPRFKPRPDAADASSLLPERVANTRS